jgi:ArsR family transcriptional regulator
MATRTSTSQARYKARAAIIKALAHPTRLQIVDALAGGERCVCELHRLGGGTVPTISRHLSVLKHAGIVKDEKRGLQVFYKLCCPCLNSFFACIEGILKKSVEDKACLV